MMEPAYPPSRRQWMIAGLLFLGNCVNYLDRQTLSVLAPVLRDEFGMTNTDYSYIVNAFLLAYMIMYALGGRIMDWIGTRLGMALNVIWWSIAECLHALARSALQLGVFRFLLAVGEGGFVPGSEKAIAESMAPHRRPLAISIMLVGAMVGGAMAPPLVVWLTRLHSWRFAFLLTGLIGFSWVIVWVNFYRPPARARGAVGSALAGAVASPGDSLLSRPLPWFRLFTFRGAVGVFLGRFFIDAAWYFYLFWLPEFLKHEKGFNLDEIGRIAWMPFLAADLGAIAGGASATWLQRRGWGTDRSHKTVMLVGNLLLCSPLVLARTENIAWSVVWICAGTFAIQMWGANVHAIPTHLFHSRTVGSVSGLAGACGALGGILLMRLVGYIVDHFASYGLVLYVVGGFCPLMAYLAHRVIGPVRRVG